MTTRLPLAKLRCERLGCDSLHLCPTHIHLTFFLPFISASSTLLKVALPDRLGNLGDMMNVRSAPRLTEAITRLLRLSECFLCSVSTGPSGVEHYKGSLPYVDVPIFVPIKHYMIKLHPQLFLQPDSYRLEHRWERVIHHDF